MSSTATFAAAIDDPVEQARYTTWRQSAAGERVGESHFQLSGLVCAACADLIEAALERERGVRSATVNYASRRASVRWDPALTRPSRLVGAVEAAGYEAVPDLAEPARALRLREQRAALWRLFVAAFCMMQVMMYAAPAYVAAPGAIAPDQLELLRWASWLLCLPVLLFSAGPMFRDAWEGLRRGQVRMDLPVVVGLVIAFGASSYATFAPNPGGAARDVYFDTVAMFVCFLLVARYLALRGSQRVAATLDAALAQQPSVVRRLGDGDAIELVAPHALRVGDRLRVLAGEAFAADGPIVEGRTRVDEALLTGESRPTPRGEGELALAGSVNVDAPVTQRVLRLGADTRQDAVIALMREALTQRPPLLAAADRYAAPFLWGVLLLAALAGAVWSVIDPSRALWIAVSVLIVTCPCALSLAAPSALLAAAGSLARRGVLVHRLGALEALAEIDTVVFDKTGTLTEDRLQLNDVRSFVAAHDAASLQARAAALATQSTHPLSRALAASTRPEGVWTDIVEHPGRGLQAQAPDGATWRLGAREWVAGDADAVPGAQVWFGRDGRAMAAYTFGEALRADAAEAVTALQRAPLTVSLLSGDEPGRVARVAAQLGIDSAEGGATPERKLECIAAAQRQGHRVAMVGDGLNDAPVVARADVSFAFAHGAAITQSSADFILLGTRVGDVVCARDTARRAMRVLRQNLAWAAAYNLVCVPLALAGLFPPWAAGLGMALSSLGVVLNALRV